MKNPMGGGYLNPPAGAKVPINTAPDPATDNCLPASEVRTLQTVPALAKLKLPPEIQCCLANIGACSHWM